MRSVVRPCWSCCVLLAVSLILFRHRITSTKKCSRTTRTQSRKSFCPTSIQVVSCGVAIVCAAAHTQHSRLLPLYAGQHRVRSLDYQGRKWKFVVSGAFHHPFPRPLFGGPRRKAAGWSVLVYWCTVLVSWCPGVLVYWCTVRLVYWCTGVLASCVLCTGVLVD